MTPVIDDAIISKGVKVDGVSLLFTDIFEGSNPFIIAVVRARFRKYVVVLLIPKKNFILY